MKCLWEKDIIERNIERILAEDVTEFKPEHVR